MDLSKVFGAGEGGGNFFSHTSNTSGGGGGGQQSAPFFMNQGLSLPQNSQLPVGTMGNHTHLAWDVVGSLQEAWNYQAAAADKVAHQVATIQKSVEATRAAYNQVIQERDRLRASLQTAENRVAEVQRVVQRYAVVQDPVVASDGFTYERGVIQNYLNDCKHEGQPAISQQTKEELGPNLVPNQSLKKLVDLLKTIRPQEVPPAQARAAPPPCQPAHRHQEVQRVVSTEGGHDDKNRGDGVSFCTVCNITLGSPEEFDSHCKDRSHLENVWSQTNQGGKDGERLHPCVRVYGFCNYKESCTYANYPFEACLSHLKGKCRFGTQCKELHVEPNSRPKPRFTPGGGRGRGGRGE